MKKLDPQTRAFLLKEVERLKFNPHQFPKLSGRASFLRSYHTNFRGVAYRIVFEIRESAKEILVYLAAPRSRVYELLKRLF